MYPVETVTIDKCVIGPHERAFIVAEAGVNHNGDVELARQLVDVAAQAGVDAVKFQTFKAERVVSATAAKAAYQLQSTDPGESQLDMLRRLELSLDAQCELQAYCHERGVIFMSTPFDETSADFLASLDVPVFKIPSGELTNLPFLTHVAHKGKPLIISTGMAYLGEVDEAVRTIRNAGCREFILLHCVSTYPAEPADINLRAMQTMPTAFLVPVAE
jgi:N-acetylneuraminate synthase/N,N'-diacetyllegionaminate synthase